MKDRRKQKRWPKEKYFLILRRELQNKREKEK